MLSVLIVEDDTEKLRKISSTLTSIPGIELANIKDARTLHEARVLLSSGAFDLLILDLSLPNNIESEPMEDGGIRLLDEMFSRDKYQKPANIIAVTRYDKIIADQQRRFSERLISVVRCADDNLEWLSPIKNKAADLLSSKQAARNALRGYDALLCIICALPEPELSAVRNNGWVWEPHALHDDTTRYYRTSVIIGGRTQYIYAAAAPRMGMTASSVLSSKMIFHFRPKYLCMSGIAAGTHGKVNFGDIVVPDPVWDWGHGKWRTSEDGPIFEIEPHQVPLDVAIREILLEISADSHLLLDIRERFGGDKPDTVLKLQIGPFASGASVVADSNVADQIREQHRRLIAMDMEAYGVYIAAQEAPLPRPTVFALKSIVDFANKEKNDKYHRFAAYTSAAMVKVFVEKICKKDLK